MSVMFRCPICDGVHPSRLVAKQLRSFHEALPQLAAEVLEICPVTNTWTQLTFADLEWRGDEALVVSLA